MLYLAVPSRNCWDGSFVSTRVPESPDISSRIITVTQPPVQRVSTSSTIGNRGIALTIVPDLNQNQKQEKEQSEGTDKGIRGRNAVGVDILRAIGYFAKIKEQLELSLGLIGDGVSRPKWVKPDCNTVCPHFSLQGLRRLIKPMGAP